MKLLMRRLVAGLAKPLNVQPMLEFIAKMMVRVQTLRPGAPIAGDGPNYVAALNGTADGVIRQVPITIGLHHLTPHALGDSTSLLRLGVPGLGSAVSRTQSVARKVRLPMLAEFIIGVELRSGHPTKFTAWCVS